MNIIRKSFRYLKYRIPKVLFRTTDFRLAKGKLLSSKALSDKEKALLDKVSLRVHRNDEMYARFAARHYISVGLSAIRCIGNALDKSNGDNVVRYILDFPCGHGRVLRYGFTKR